MAPKREGSQRLSHGAAMIQVIGMVVVFGCVIVGFLLGGGHLLLLWHPGRGPGSGRPAPFL